MLSDCDSEYGERVVSWREIRQKLDPDPEEPPEFQELAAEMYRLRGLVMAQCAETEAVLGQIVWALNPEAKIEVPAGVLLKTLRSSMPATSQEEWSGALDTIDNAIKTRNHAVHSDVEIGSTWVDYATGGGEYAPVISIMQAGAYDDGDLRRDLALEQHATELAVRLAVALQGPAHSEPRRSDPEA